VRYYRQDATKRQTAGIKFTHRPKIRFFAPQGRLAAPIHVKLVSADGHVGPLGFAKFHLNQRRGVGMRLPKNIKNFHFLVKSRLAGANPLTISKIFRSFYTPNYPALAFQIWRFASQVTVLLLRNRASSSIRPNFSMHPVGKTMRWIEKWMAPFLMASASSITIQSLGKIVQRVPAVGVKMCLFFGHAQESGALCCRAVHSSNKHCVAVYRPISTCFAAFFQKG